MSTTCQSIEGLQLDKESEEALSRIRYKERAGKWIAPLVSLGLIHGILMKDRPEYATIAYDITQTDWKLFMTTMASAPKIAKNAIEKEAELMVVHYEIQNNLKLRNFWMGIAYGCK